MASMALPVSPGDAVSFVVEAVNGFGSSGLSAPSAWVTVTGGCGFLRVGLGEGTAVGQVGVWCATCV